jgi:hypothetical protein
MFKGIYKATTPEGKCLSYNEGDIVFKNGEAYIATRDISVCLSPEHKTSGWKPLTNESSGTSVTFYNSTTPPIRVTQGDEWFNPDSGILYKYIVDPTSEQWVQIF